MRLVLEGSEAVRRRDERKQSASERREKERRRDVGKKTGCGGEVANKIKGGFT